MRLSPSPPALTRVLRAALLAGGAVLKKAHHERPRVSYKTPTSPVTQVDLRAEKAIIQLIRRNFPDHTFLAEESAFLKQGDIGPSRADRYRWVIDPLDGTVNFIHGIPQFCVSIAVEKGGAVLAGGIYDPSRDELFLAARGRGATLNGKRIAVSKQTDFRQSLIITGFPYDRDKKALYYLSLLEPFVRGSGGVRRFGSAAIDLAWVACGRADGYWECGLNPWDVAAGWLLVEEAGGRVSRFRGEPFRLDDTSETLASNGVVHGAMSMLFGKSGKRRAGRTQKIRGQTPNQI